MRRVLAILATSTLACAMSVAPVLADTTTTAATSNTTTFHNTLDCLALLFTNPTLHAQKCGGPNFTPAPAPNAGGDGSACHEAMIAPFDVTGTPVKSDVDTLVATSCCYGELTTPQQQLTPLFDTLWGPADRAWLVTATAGC